MCFLGPQPEAVKCDQVFNSKYRVTSLIYSICFVQRHSHVLNISLDFAQEMVDELTLFFFRNSQSCFGRILSFFFFPFLLKDLIFCAHSSDVFEYTHFFESFLSEP